MTKIISYTAMVLLSGAGAAASGFEGGLPSMWRGLILGSVLALSIVVGACFTSKNKLKNNLIQITIGIIAGIIAALLIVFFRLETFGREFYLELKSIPLVIAICAIYGGGFQWIVVCSGKMKFLKLFLLAFVCIGIRFYFLNLELLLAAFASAFLFAFLWYLPVWFFYVRKRSITDYIEFPEKYLTCWRANA